MSKKLKEQAKRQLKNNWPASVAGVLIICVCAIIVVNLSGIFIYLNEIIDADVISSIFATLMVAVTVAAIFLLMPLWLGFKRFCYIVSKNGKAELSDIFHFISDRLRYSRALAIGFGSLWRAIVLLLIFGVPLSIIAAAVWIISDSITHGAGAIDIRIICVLIDFVIALLISQRYALAHYIFFENEDLPARMCFFYARHIYRDQRKSLITLALSFFPWYLLLPLAIPLLYIMPYISVTFGNFAKWSLYNYLRQNPDPFVIHRSEEPSPELTPEEENSEISDETIDKPIYTE